jgi:putative membrane protein
MMWDGGWGFWHLVGAAFMMFFWLLLLAGVVLLVVWLIRAASRDDKSSEARGRGDIRHYSGTEQACDVARMRYARGEITKGEFEEICRTLGH